MVGVSGELSAGGGRETGLPWHSPAAAPPLRLDLLGRDQNKKGEDLRWNPGPGANQDQDHNPQLLAFQPLSFLY